MSDSSDDEIDKIDFDIQTEQIDDYLILEKNYEQMKQTNISKPVLSKYERTKIIAERTQQLSNGSISFIKNPESYNTIYEIAIEELKQKKIPFIIKRPVSNKFEYWKLSDLSII
jgi:DNA-directed RNA polymerase subunit K/omega